MTRPRFTKTIYYLFGFVILECFVLAMLLYNRQQQHMHHEEEITGELASKNNAVFTQYKKLSEVLVSTIVQRPDILSLVQDGLHGSEAMRDEKRAELLEKLLPVYKALARSGVKQFHFHFPDGTSFLRLHDPESYGDNISKFRHSVRLANEGKVQVFGFEEGRAGNGLRYVFPLSFNGEHIGSVETSISFEAIGASLDDISKGEYRLFIKKDALKDIVLLKNYEKNYRQYEISSTYLQDWTYENKKNSVQVTRFMSEVDKKNKNEIVERMAYAKPFAVYSKTSGGYISATFLPVFNILGAHVAFLADYERDSVYDFYDQSFIRTFAISTVFVAIFFIIVFIVNNKREKIWQLSATLKEKSEELETVLDAAGNGIAILAIDGTILYANSAFLQLFGYTLAELMGRNCKQLSVAEENADMMKAIESAAANGNLKGFRKICVKKSGKRLVADISITLLPDEQSLVVAINDITEHAAHTERLEQKASMDMLTGVYNRRKMEELLHDQLGGEVFCIVLMDIDCFKSINDTFGHACGDTVLMKFSTVVASNIRSTDVFGRWGGEEFLILLPNTLMEAALKISEKLRAAVESTSFDGAGRVTCSFGVAQGGDGSVDDKYELLARADEALYRAKNGGRNRVEAAS